MLVGGLGAAVSLCLMPAFGVVSMWLEAMLMAITYVHLVMTQVYI